MTPLDVPSWRRPAHVGGRRKQRAGGNDARRRAGRTNLTGPLGDGRSGIAGRAAIVTACAPSRAEPTCATMSPCCSASASRACHSLSPATQSIVSTCRARESLSLRQSNQSRSRTAMCAACYALLYIWLLHGSAAICLRTPITRNRSFAIRLGNGGWSCSATHAVPCLLHLQRALPCYFHLFDVESRRVVDVGNAEEFLHLRERIRFRARARATRMHGASVRRQ